MLQKPLGGCWQMAIPVLWMMLKQAGLALKAVVDRACKCLEITGNEVRKTWIIFGSAGIGIVWIAVGGAILYFGDQSLELPKKDFSQMTPEERENYMIVWHYKAGLYYEGAKILLTSAVLSVSAGIIASTACFIFDRVVLSSVNKKTLENVANQPNFNQIVEERIRSQQIQDELTQTERKRNKLAARNKTLRNERRSLRQLALWQQNELNDLEQKRKRKGRR